MRWVTLPLTLVIGLASAFIMAAPPANVAPPPQAPLEVLHDSGQTLPLEPLLDAAGFREATPHPPARPTQRDAALEHRRTVHSPSLSPGVQPRLPVGQAGTVLPRPLFLVGADPGSLAWLRTHRARLAAIDAVGLVVEVAGAEDLQRVRTAAGDRVLALGSGEALAEHFGLRHYPVLIGPQWIEQ